MFSRDSLRLGVLLLALASFYLIPPEVLARGPDLCLWKHLFHLSACPACGSTRALAAFFHGEFGLALRFNHNVVITGPGLVALITVDAVRLLRKVRGSHPCVLKSSIGQTTF